MDLENELEQAERVRDHAAIATILGALADAAPTIEQRIGYSARRAIVCEEKLGDVEGAIRTWTAILELDPSSADALGALRRLLAIAGDWSQLASVLEHAVAVATEPTSVRTFAGELARIYGEQLGDTEKAAEWEARARE
jgi:tetratricopeptide (TPR) repeat protein